VSDHTALPRHVPEGTIPLVAFEDDAYECGRQYAEYTLAHHRGYRTYLDMAWEFTDLSDVARKLFEQRAPHILDLCRGLTDVAGPPQNDPQPGTGCTSFAVSGEMTLDAGPISGQTKDTPLDRAERYIVLRLRLTGAPTILVLCYPGEVLGYGMWSTGMSIFRNSLYTTGAGEGLLTRVQWGLLALAGESVGEAAELAEQHGVAGIGNCLIADATGESLSVEYSNGGTCVVPAEGGISVHTNHGLTPGTQAVEADRDPVETADSRYRRGRLLELLRSEAGRLTPQKLLALLGDHSRYPRGICRHLAAGMDYATTAAAIAEPARGLLHVVRGSPCCNWPVTYTT